jgi:hypothetical protein
MPEHGQKDDYGSLAANIAANMARAIDPSLIMHDLGMVPDPWQSRLLRSGSNRVLLLCSRQLGKSTATACLAIAQACYAADSLV